MAGADALKMVEHVRTRLVDLAVSENYVRDSRFSEAARKVWEGLGADGGLVSELWVEGAFSGELSCDSLQSLSDEGIFPYDLCHHIDARKTFPVSRLLYQHQSETIRRAATGRSGEKPSLVITAGTGLGKTEAFLLPMLSDLWSASDRRRNGGMRCLILYPMNALIADQVSRIYEWLMGQERLTVFHFTRATPESNRRANLEGEPNWEQCRARTREEARGFETHDGVPITTEPFGQVPDIVITNYSMLEYMLSRPQDSRFFGPDLRCIILDEAHLYSGVLAAEIMMLLRRVKERCGVSSSQTLHIATSATLGGDDDELRGFASSLFSADAANTTIIRGRLVENDLGSAESRPTQPAAASEIASLAACDFMTLNSDDQLIENDEKTVDELLPIVSHLVSASTLNRSQRENPSTPARFLHSSLRQAPLIRQMAGVLAKLAKERGSILSLDDLASRLFEGRHGPYERDASIALLRLASVARTRSTDLPLVPHRLHFLVRAPEGLSVCLNPRCSGPNGRRIESVGCLQSVADLCQYCGHVLLPVHRCFNCGEWAMAGHENQEALTLEPGYFSSSAMDRTYYLLVRPQHLNLEEVVVDSESGEIHGHGARGVSLWKAPRLTPDAQVQQCPTCCSSWSVADDEEDQPEWRHTCRSLVGGHGFALSLAAETILHDLPTYQDGSRNWKPAGGRRLLCFSDSRTSAARLGPRLTQQHEMQVVRAALARCVRDLTPGGAAAYLAEEVQKLKQLIQSSGHDRGLRQHLEIELAEKRRKLTQSKIGTPFSDFVKLVAKQDEMAQILDRASGDKHDADSYGQSDWNRNKKAVQQHIEGLVAKELERPLKRQISVESVGLLEFVYPGTEMLSIPPSLEERLPSVSRDRIRDVWPQMVTLLLESVRADGCMDWSEHTPSREWLDESPLMARWLTRTRGGWKSRAFVGATVAQLRRGFVRNVLRSAGCTEETLEELSWDTLCAMFDQLYSLASDQDQKLVWLRHEDHHQTGPEEDDKAIQVLFDALSVRVPTQLYVCDATRTIWTHSALGWAPIKGCRGTLRPVSSEELDGDARWGRPRREFIESPIFSTGSWAEEHSAQLSPHENRRLQDLFKKGIRNILSSTTTMELGIDIGGLNGVFLSNVPPGPANHRQRAGRAGRRSDGSAVVVTYARDSQYDREVFRHFGDFLGRDLRKPTVAFERERIIRRHLQAVLLSEFIRAKQPAKTGAMQAFGRMGSFCGVNPPPRWTRSSEPRPLWIPDDVSIADSFVEFLNQLQTGDNEIRNSLLRLSRQTPMNEIGELHGWHNLLAAAADVFRKAVDEWKSDTQQLREAWDEIPLQPTTSKGREMAKANSIRHMARALCDITVIEWLADRRFLPRYGFPINLQSLTVRRANEGSKRSTPDERYQLERNSLLALREYVPESRVLVGGRLATSRGLRKHWTDTNVDKALGLEYFSLECAEGHVYVRQSREEICPRCDGDPVRRQQLVFPRFGYTTAGWEKMPLGTDLERIGEQSVCPTAFAEHGGDETLENFAGIHEAQATYREEAELLVRNAGRRGCGFAICTRCGFAMSESDYGQGRMNLPKDFDKHASVFYSDPSSFCWTKGDQTTPSVLRNRVLAARELTDMILIEWPRAMSHERDAVFSLGRALVLGGTRLLELDERELGMELVPLRDKKLGIAVYDTAPGGAGHCRELVNDGEKWIEATHAVLYVNHTHHSRCRKACLECILDFSGQYSANRLNRLAAIDLLDAAIA